MLGTIIILDNFRTHHAKKVKKEAEKLNISLVYLPPYSSDLNPIENVWKIICKKLDWKSSLVIGLRCYAVDHNSLDEFIDWYNNVRFHESLDTKRYLPEDGFWRRLQAIFGLV